METNPGYGYIYDRDENGAPVTRYDFEITGMEENNRVSVTAYNRRLEGPLTIKKLVVNAGGTPLTYSNWRRNSYLPSHFPTEAPTPAKSAKAPSKRS